MPPDLLPSFLSCASTSAAVAVATTLLLLPRPSVPPSPAYIPPFAPLPPNHLCFCYCWLVMLCLLLLVHSGVY